MPLTNSNGESWTQGLTGLIDRSSEYYKQVPCRSLQLLDQCCSCSVAVAAALLSTCAVLPMHTCATACSWWW